jgi:hypothetical protein
LGEQQEEEFLHKQFQRIRLFFILQVIIFLACLLDKLIHSGARDNKLSFKHFKRHFHEEQSLCVEDGVS